MTSMDPVKLKCNDRIIFGTSSVYIFKHMAKAEESGDPTDDPPITFEFAMNERL